MPQIVIDQFLKKFFFLIFIKQCNLMVELNLDLKKIKLNSEKTKIKY